VNLVHVPTDKAAEAWPFGEQFVKAAIERADFCDVQRVRSDVLSGTALLWLAADGKTVIGAGVTQLVEGNAGRVCEIIAWGAESQRRCAPLLETIHEYARSEGCVKTRLIGRKGWARALPAYKIRALIMEKAI
jgi:hypothetical protein